MNTVYSCLSRFLAHQASQGIAPDLLARWTPEMETQVNVIKGRPVDDHGGSWSNDSHTWWNIRVPKRADSEPEFKDYKLDWPLDLYADAIGATGWDWQNRRSLWVGFDFDTIVGHALGVGISDEELAKVRERASALPYVQVRKSTGGRGLHLYVYLDGVPTENHTTHAALARAVLGMMSAEAGFDFASHVDACGHILWLWRRGMPEDGLALVKNHERTLGADDLPENWRDHIEVVTKKRDKIRVRGVTNESAFDTLTRSRSIVDLEPDHDRVIELLCDSGFSTFWVHDHHLLQTHTCALAKVFEDEDLKGVYSTASNGSNPGMPNCFGFPLAGGGWKFYRFSQGVNESSTWTQDGEGWTTCFFNRIPGLKAACIANGGIIDPDNAEFVFSSKEKAEAAIRAMGESFELPAEANVRKVRLAKGKDGHLVVKIERKKDDAEIDGWIAKRGHSIRRLDVGLSEHAEGVTDFDSLMRKLVTPDCESVGWVTRTKDGDWCAVDKGDAKSFLIAQGVGKHELEVVLGNSIHQPWKLVNLPFQNEYPGGRQWNADSAQF